MLNKVLKTYPDGSQMTVLGAIATAGLTLAVGAVASVTTVAWQNWRDERFVKKNKLGKYAPK